MKRPTFFQVLAMAGFLAGWLERAAADGKLTVAEVAELVDGAARTAGIDLKIEFPGAGPVQG